MSEKLLSKPDKK